MNDSYLKTYSFRASEDQKPDNLVIFLHGLGANGQDLIGLGPHFAEKLPNTVFVSPDAPHACDMAPTGYQWFSLQDRDPMKILAGVQAAAPILEEYIQTQMNKYGVPAEKTVLVGFSQGTMMSLYVGPRFKNKLAGILAYSGALIWEHDTDTENLNKIPVHLVHGDVDQVVAIDAYHAAKKDLEETGFEVSGGITEGLGHGIDEEGIRSGSAFLHRILFS